MAAANINRVVLTGNLTSDPDLRETPGGLKICRLRLAVNGRRKQNDQWVDKVGYFDIVVFGGNGENAARYLSKGRPVAIDGRLEWREWQDKETGKNRQGVEIVADTVQFLGGRDENGGGGGGQQQARSAGPDISNEFQQAGAAGYGIPGATAGAPQGQQGFTNDDDIPF